MKSITIHSEVELSKINIVIMKNMDRACGMLQKLLCDCKSDRAFALMKFEKVVVDPLTGEPENLIEVINQTQTYLVSLKAAEYLIHRYPGHSFILNMGNVSGYDIQSEDESIIAECFAATSYNSNGKLNADLKALENNGTATYKYEFFYDKKYGSLQSVAYKEKYKDIEIIKFEDLQLQTHQDYSFILKMQDYLKEEGLLYSTTIPELVIARKNGKIFSFEEHLQGLIYAFLSAHTTWSRIAPKLSLVDDIFFQYDLKHIKTQKGIYFTNELKSIKCASQCTSNQMNHLHENIERLQKIETDYGSLDAFVTSAEPDKIVKDLASGNHKLYGIGPALAWEYLRNVGIDGVKPDVHICRFLGANRIGMSDRAEPLPEEVVEIVRDMSKKLDLPMVVIDSIIWSYCADGFGEICSANPKCEQCVVKEYCSVK